MFELITIAQLENNENLEGLWFSKAGECCGVDAQVMGNQVIVTNFVCGHGAQYRDEAIPLVMLKDAILRLATDVKLTNGRVVEDIEIQLSLSGGYTLDICLDRYDTLDDFVLR